MGEFGRSVVGQGRTESLEPALPRRLVARVQLLIIGCCLKGCQTSGPPAASATSGACYDGLAMAGEAGWRTLSASKAAG